MNTENVAKLEKIAMEYFSLDYIDEHPISRVENGLEVVFSISSHKITIPVVIDLQTEQNFGKVVVNALCEHYDSLTINGITLQLLNKGIYTIEQAFERVVDGKGLLLGFIAAVAAGFCVDVVDSKGLRLNHSKAGGAAIISASFLAYVDYFNFAFDVKYSSLESLADNISEISINKKAFVASHIEAVLAGESQSDIGSIVSAERSLEVFLLYFKRGIKSAVAVLTAK